MMRNLGRWIGIVVLAHLGVFSLGARSELCARWAPARTIGTIDRNALREASGIVFSRRFPDRAYLHNDSGAKAEFFVAHANGTVQQKISLAGRPSLTDVEDIALGPCGANRTCIYLADIGDNRRQRKSIQVVLIEERERFVASVAPLTTLTLTYPDGPHNAEGLAVDRLGNIYVLTKETDGTAILYRWSPDVRALSGPLSGQLVEVGRIRLPVFARSFNRFRSVPAQAPRATGFDIAVHGRTFVVLTYEAFIEFDLDLAQTARFQFDELRPGHDYRAWATHPLEQQEAIAYTPDADGIVYLSEAVSRPSPVIYHRCER